MEMNPYLNFKGDCEAALTFYAECLAGKLGELFRYGGTPMADQAPAGWENKVMHGSVTIAGQTVMGADVPPERYEKPAGFSLRSRSRTWLRPSRSSIVSPPVAP